MPQDSSDPEQIHPPPTLTSEELAQRANAFLDRYHPSRALPVPIEEIVEFDLGLNVIPVPGLRRDTGFDGFISSDLQEITVDEDQLLRYPNRYHFTLAHELAHKELHAALYMQLSFRTITEWQEFVHEIGPVLHDRLEQEADEFAGMLLVPTDSLRIRFAENLQKAEKRGIDTRTRSRQLIEHIADFLAPEFEVSAQVIKIRILREKLHRRPGG